MKTSDSCIDDELRILTDAPYDLFLVVLARFLGTHEDWCPTFDEEGIPDGVRRSGW